MRFRTKLVKYAVITLALASMVITAGATELKIGVGYVQSSGLRLRAAASTDADIVSTASYGDTVIVIRKTNDNWYLVDYNLDVGYMSADYINFKAVESVELGTGTANVSVNVRSKPATDGDLVMQIAGGDTMTIIGLNNSWYKITKGGKTGYVRSDLVTLSSKPTYNSASGSAASVSSQVVSYAEDYLGTPYVWGGTSPSGFDCSGFTKYVYSAFGYSLNRTAASQLNNGTSVSKSNLAAGDLVFFSNTYNSYAAATHVGIYVGNNQFIHAASGGVKVTSLSDSYYAGRYVGARRIV